MVFDLCDVLPKPISATMFLVYSGWHSGACRVVKWLLTGELYSFYYFLIECLFRVEQWMVDRHYLPGVFGPFPSTKDTPLVFLTQASTASWSDAGRLPRFEM